MVSPVPEPAKEQSLSKKTAEVFTETLHVDESPLESTNKSLFVLGLIVFGFIVLATGGVYYLSTRITAGSEVSQEVTKLNSEEVSKTNQLNLAREEISLEILNGSGVPGAAAESAKTFTDLGYKVVKTGNADLISKSQLFVNSEVKDELELLLNDVEKELGISKITGEFSDSSASARIILGGD